MQFQNDEAWAWLALLVTLAVAMGIYGTGCAPKPPDLLPVPMPPCTVAQIEAWVNDTELTQVEVQQLVGGCRDLELLAEIRRLHMSSIGKKAKAATDCELLGECR